MRIIGITKIRNEEKIIKETLDHWGAICTGGIYIIDDASDDKTVEICRAHPSVKSVQEVVHWDPDGERADAAHFRYRHRRLPVAGSKRAAGEESGDKDGGDIFFQNHSFTSWIVAAAAGCRRRLLNRRITTTKKSGIKKMARAVADSMPPSTPVRTNLLLPSLKHPHPRLNQ